MKKLIALTLILCLVPLTALACETTPPSASQTPPLAGEAMPVVKIENGCEAFSGCAWFAIESDRHIIGKWSADAREEIFTARELDKLYILGLLENGVVRAKGELKYIEADGTILGLTKLACTVEIKAEYAKTVQDIVEARTGGTLSTAAVIAATQWRTAETIYHVFFLPDAVKAPVGTLWLNGGKSAVTLYVGEFCGVKVLGFVTGGIRDEEKPKAAETPAPVTQTVYVTQRVEQKTCIKIIQDNRQINIGSTVDNRQAQTVILGGKGCGSKPVCVEN